MYADLGISKVQKNHANSPFSPVFSCKFPDSKESGEGGGLGLPAPILSRASDLTIFHFFHRFMRTHHKSLIEGQIYRILLLQLCDIVASLTLILRARMRKLSAHV